MRVVFDLDFDTGAWPGPLAGRDPVVLSPGPPGSAAAGETWVGPAGFLELLETRFGLGGPRASPAERIASLLAPIRDVEGFWSRSAEADVIETAASLLRWRDTLWAGGWRGQGLSPRLADLARVTAEVPAGFSDRLSAVEETLRRRSPRITAVELFEPATELPAVWARIVGALANRGTMIRTRRPDPPGGSGGRAAVASGDLRDARAPGFAPRGDGSLQLLRTHGPLQAAEEVAAWIAAREGPSDTLIIDPDPVLDAALRRHGLPTTGAPAAGGPATGSHDLLSQILPLVLALGWHPADPRRALELLTVPVNPVPPEIAGRLIDALSRWPAVDSDRWREQLDAGLAAIEDPERRRRARERLGAFFRPAAGNGDAYPAAEIRRRAAALLQWLGDRPPPTQEDEARWRAAAEQCTGLLAFIDRTGLAELTALELQRLLALAGNAAPSPFPAQAGLAAVQRPGAVTAAAEWIVWWGFSSDRVPRQQALPLTQSETAALTAAGIRLPDPGGEAERLAGRWQRPFLAARESLVLVCPHRGEDGEELFPHPLWDEVCARLSDRELAGRLERSALLSRPAAPRRRPPLAPLPSFRPAWTVAPASVARRTRESPSSAGTLLGCSFKWVCEYAGGLRAGSSRSLESFGDLLGPPAVRGDLLDRNLRRVVERFVRRVDRETDATKKTAQAVERAAEAGAFLRAHGRLRWKHWASLAELRPGKKSDELAAEVRRAARVQDRHPGLRADVREAIELIFAIASRALAAYEGYKQAWGILDFVDQEVKALELLAEPRVRLELASELDLVLVDEFQDTSPIQLALFFELAKLAGCSVWVGDQKQAVYGFRGTDPALMDAATLHILGGGEPATLDRCWRSRPALVDLTSELFARAFGELGIPRSRVALEAVREESEALGPAVEHWRLEARNQGQAVQALAAAMRDFLADPAVRVEDRARRGPRAVRPSDVSVLCRRNATAAAVARELAALGVPAQIPRSGLLSTPEARLVVAALRLWVDPADPLAAAEIARLLEYAERTDEWLAAALSEPKAGAFRRLPAFERLLAARGSNLLAGPVAALDLATEAVEARERCLWWGDSEARLANLEALRALAVRYARSRPLDQGGSTPAGLVCHLDDLEELGADPRPIPTGAEAVTVTTWHGAKGLEWPVTVLFELDTAFPPSPLGVRVVSDRQSFDAGDPLAGRWVRYWPNPYHPRQKKMPFHRRLAEHRATDATLASWRSERLRLLYVGWTRARDRLVLASRPGKLAAGILDSLQADGQPLVTEPGEEGTVWGGRPVEVYERRAEPAEPVPRPPRPGEGYVAAGPREHPPASLAPSGLEGEAAVGEIVRLGDGIALAGGSAGIAFGEAVHGFYAADGRSLPRRERLLIAGGLIERWGLAAVLGAEDLLASADRLYRWIDSRWRRAELHREWPLHHRLGTGTVVRGAADLVIETPKVCILVDHKSYDREDREAVERARQYGAQLGAYAAAAAAAVGKPVAGTFIHLPVAGLAVELLIPREDER